MDKIRVLQLGDADWRGLYTIPDIAEIEYWGPEEPDVANGTATKPEDIGVVAENEVAKPEDPGMVAGNESAKQPETGKEATEKAMKTPPKKLKQFDLVFLGRTPTFDELKELHKLTKAYTLFYTENVEVNGPVNWLITCRKGEILPTAKVQEFLSKELRNFFPKPYGEKFRTRNMAVTHGFKGDVSWDGSYAACLNGSFGTDWQQIVYWRNCIPITSGQAIDFWLEYEKTGSVEVKLVLTQFVQGSVSDIQTRVEFTEEEMKEPVTFDNEKATGPVFAALFSKGEGELKIIALHDRYSRRGYGAFLPGGERYVASNREEVFAYFDPGDRKPPLAVYFSGYKTLEGFEGYNMMRKLGCPFLLIAETRMEGGNFYMGDEEYEQIIPSIIKKHLDELGFDKSQLLLSGLSMGTYGALYYGCDTRPHAMILGKPLVSIGDVAANERLNRPGGFPTSLDVLHHLCGKASEGAVEKLNTRFWDKFDATDWKDSKFIISYMIEDDYDANAYDMLISHLHSSGVQVYGKGIHGKHNDDTASIVNWFLGQYDKVLLEDFSRRVER